MSSKPRRLAVLAVATTLAAATGTAQATPVPAAAAPAKPSGQWVVVSEAAAATPPANVTALARSLGVDTAFAWRTLDELAQTPGRKAASVKAAPGHPTPHRH